MKHPLQYMRTPVSVPNDGQLVAFLVIVALSIIGLVFGVGYACWQAGQL